MTVHLLDLPPEILQQIFSWVPARALLRDASLVCRRFHEILHTDWYWRGRYIEEARAQPPVEQPSMRLWQVGCLQWEFARTAAAGGLSYSTTSGEVLIAHGRLITVIYTACSSLLAMKLAPSFHVCCRCTEVTSFNVQSSC